jgi:hypothetical protein
VRIYSLFLGALLVIGLGLACLETSVSPYLIRLGPAATAARRVNFAAVWNPCGSVAGARSRARAVHAATLEIIPHHETFRTTIQPPYSSTKG